MYSANSPQVQGPISMNGLAALNEQYGNQVVQKQNNDILGGDINSTSNNDKDTAAINVNIQNKIPEDNTQQVLKQPLPVKKKGYNKKLISALFVIWLLLGGYYFTNQDGEFLGANIFGSSDNNTVNTDLTTLPNIGNSDIDNSVVKNTTMIDKSTSIIDDDIDSLFINGENEINKSINNGNFNSLSETIDAVVLANLDSDKDGVNDQLEISIGSNPYNPDSDNDGIDDLRELNLYNTDPTKADTDGDGKTDGFELTHHSNPNLKD